MSYRLMSFAHVSCLTSHVKPRNGNAITPYAFEGEEGQKSFAFLEGDVRRETRDERRH